MSPYLTTEVNLYQNSNLGEVRSMTNTLEDEVRRIIANMDNEQHSQEQEQPDTTEQEQEPEETIHIHYFPDAIVMLKEDADTAQVVDSVPVIPQNISFLPAYAICVLYLFLIFSCIAFQVYEILNPPLATVTIIPKSQTVTLTGTLQIGRVLQPLTISQSQTVPTTGKGHQPARSATGYITFYNGLFTSQSVPAGILLTGNDGVEIITDQYATIPEAFPPNLGYTIVSAHALYPGSSGNIPAYDINQACCATAIKAVNTTSFTGGQDERNFQTVAKADIASVATPLKTAVMQSLQGALQGQVQEPEQLFILPCNPTVISDHKPGEEATEVKVTVSQTCSAVAYNSQELTQKSTDLLTQQATTQPGAGYSLFGDVHVTVTQATIQKHVIVSFYAQGIWIYALSQKAQEHIKALIAGKSKQQALHLLASLPGIEHTSIAWSDDTKLPKNVQNIHLHILVQNF
jgi:hypothetical protein